MEGVYGFVVMMDDKFIGVCDLLGICLLILGYFDGVYIFCLEICVLDIIGVEFICEVDLGEVVVIFKVGVKSFLFFLK